MTTYRFIDAEKAHHAVRTMCHVSGVSHAAYYDWRNTQSNSHTNSNALVRLHIGGTHRASRGTYGSPCMTAALGKRDLRINHNRVASIMREEAPKAFRGDASSARRPSLRTRVPTRRTYSRAIPPWRRHTGVGG